MKAQFFASVALVFLTAAPLDFAHSVQARNRVADATDIVLPSAVEKLNYAKTLDPATVTERIRDEEPSARDDVVSDVQSRLNLTREAVPEFRDSIRSLPADVRSNLGEIIDDVAQSRDRLKRSLGEVQNATAQTWEDARDDLVQRYREFAQTLGETEAEIKVAVANQARGYVVNG